MVHATFLLGDTMKDLMMLYGVTLARRYKKKQKAYFINQIGEFYPEKGFKVALQEKSARFFTLMNVIAGDISTAKTVFVAAYDTPSKAFLPNTKYYPFHAERNISEERLNLVSQIGLSLIAIVGAYFCFRLFMNAQGGMKALYLILAGALSLLALLSVRTKANAYNFNKNSASLAVMAKIAKRCKDNKDIAFAFLDYQASSFEGIKALMEDKRFLDKNLIMLDCIASGQTLILAHRAMTNNKADRLIEIAKANNVEMIDREYSEQRAEQNVMSFAKQLLYIVSGSVEDKEFIVKKTRTKKDVDLDMKRLEGIAETLTNFIKNGGK